MVEVKSHVREGLRLRKQTNRQATQEAREIAKDGGPAHASVQDMLAEMNEDQA